MHLSFQFSQTCPDYHPRGELWLGNTLFNAKGLKNDLEGHLRLCERLGHHLICLPLSIEKSQNPIMGYRYFTPKELKQFRRIWQGCTVAIIEGPFQRLVDQLGLYDLLRTWKQNRADIESAYLFQSQKISLLLDYTLEHAIDAVVIADDLASERSPFIRSEDTEALFSDFYRKTVSRIHDAGITALFHSCGSLASLTTDLISYGFNGFAAIENRLNPIMALKNQYGASLWLMTGIDTELLQPPRASHESLGNFQILIQSLAAAGGYILTSSCGLYSSDFLSRIIEIYRIADQIKT